MPKASALKPFPKPISLWKMIGPSFIILAFGLGSGELILWPYLVANHGLGIVWAALVGLTCQYFINMEIERYALVRGESVFVGLSKHLRFVPYWFIASTFVGFGLPGIIAASAQTIALSVGLTEFKWLAIALLILLGLILSAGTTVYGLMERLTKIVILTAVPLLLILVILIVRDEQLLDFGRGLLGYGPNYRFLPAGISLATFLAAFAYSGAGGNLNLAQSIYIKEKGYGMGAYSHKISGLFKGGVLDDKIKLTGEQFEHSSMNLKRFTGWWRRMNLEHGLVFGVLGFIAMGLLMILSYGSTYGQAGNEQGISFVFNQSEHVALVLGPIFGVILLIIIGLLLLQTQLGILDSTSRIMGENAALKILGKRPGTPIDLRKIYYWFVWAQVAFGIVLFLFDFKEPRQLIVLGAVINAWAMIAHIALVFYLNHRELEKEFRPKIWRKIVLGLIFIIFFGFGLVTLWSNIVN